MKGVILAGGRGTRLHPSTKVVNKHLLPVYEDPMLFYPVRTLLDAGIDDIQIVCDSESVTAIRTLVEASFDASFSYAIQSEPRGIAHAIAQAEAFVGPDDFAVVLGDNVIVGELGQFFGDYRASDGTAKILLNRVNHPHRFGVAHVEDDSLVGISEKPEDPPSNLAITGVYCYSNDVFRAIDELGPSDRGELEVTALNERYLEDGDLEWDVFDGAWFDAGTPEGLYQASNYVRARSHR